MAKLDDTQMRKVEAKASKEGMQQQEMFADKEKEVLNQEQLSIINWLKTVKFRKQIIGGVNQEDVWKKIHQLNEMYETALRAERIRYDVLLNEEKTNSSSLFRESEDLENGSADE